MEPDDDLHKEILKNAEPVLEVAAGYIRQAPTQWSMYYPLWPEALTKAP
jgi:lauroyl/myristoyl acyltransferase